MVAPLGSNIALIEKLEYIAGVTNEDVLSDQEIQRGQILLSRAREMLVRFGSWPTKTPAASFRSKLPLPEHISRLSVALAPHKRLPSELLEYTFRSHFVSEYSLKLPPVISEGPWVLGQVCRRWRHLSRSIPDLWDATISFNDIERHPDGFNNLPKADMLSRLVQLRCAIELFPEVGYICVLAVHDFSAPVPPSALIPYLSRIDQFSWNVKAEPIIKSIEKFPSEAFSRLKTLKIALPQPDDMHNNSSYVDLFGKCPQLRNFTLASNTPSFLFNHIPWSQLYSFTLNTGRNNMDGHTGSDWIQLGRRNPFSQMSSLKKLSFKMKDEFFPLILSFAFPWDQVVSLKMIWYDSPHPHTIITHWQALRKCISLTKFTLEFRDNPPEGFIFDQDTITLPSLKSLGLEQCVPSSMIKSFSLSTLSSLHFDTSISLKDFYFILKRSPLITYLSCALLGKQPTSGGTIKLLHLSSLIISLDDATSFPALLLAPSLTNLLVFSVDYETAPEIAMLSNFIWNSKMRLERFHYSLDNTDITAYDLHGDARLAIFPLRDLLAGLGWCPEVHISFVTFPQDILDDIAEGRLLPAVERLTISASTRQVLLDTIQHRLELELEQKVKSGWVGRGLCEITGYVPSDEYGDEELDVGFEELEDRFGVSCVFQSIVVLTVVDYLNVDIDALRESLEEDYFDNRVQRNKMAVPT
ncbi:hypothetical protein J132_00586 [Termitomyces sp. J132]|nr:hypothetical protein J132_00586 [Termitomyces sp. J132]